MKLGTIDKIFLLGLVTLNYIFMIIYSAPGWSYFMYAGIIITIFFLNTR